MIIISYVTLTGSLVYTEWKKACLRSLAGRLKVGGFVET